MCNNDRCGILYPLCPIVHSTSVTNAATCKINTANFTTTLAGKNFVLEVDQQLPNNTKAVTVDYGAGPIPVVDRWGNTVHADQLIKAIAYRERAKHTTYPCAVAQFVIRVCYDSIRFSVVCDLPCSSFCASSLPEPVQQGDTVESDAVVASATTATSAKK